MLTLSMDYSLRSGKRLLCKEVIQVYMKYQALIKKSPLLLMHPQGTGGIGPSLITVTTIGAHGIDAGNSNYN